MDTNYLENNYLTLVGKVTGEKKFSHEIYGERFYIFNLEIPRLSGIADIIPITISERLINEDTLTEGQKLLVKGQFRSYNSYESEKNRLILTVFAKDIKVIAEEEENQEEKQVAQVVSQSKEEEINVAATVKERPSTPAVEQLSLFSEYRQTSRGAKGVITIKSNDKIGELVSVRAVNGDEDLMVVTINGIVIRTPLAQIKIAGRNTQGVKIIRIEDKQRVSSIAIVNHVEEEEENLSLEEQNQDNTQIKESE